MDKLLYRPKEAANVLGIGRDKLYDLMRSGRLDSVKDGRARFITADALQAYVAMLQAEGAMLETCGSAGEGCTFPVTESRFSKQVWRWRAGPGR